MQFLAIAALLFVARVAAEQPQEVSNSQPVPVVGQPPVSQVVPVGVQHQPPQGPQQVVHQYSAQSYPGEQQHAVQGGQPSYAQSQQQVTGGPQQYAPSGLVQVVNAADNKPYVQVQGMPNHYAAGVVGGEQYGQPEPAGVPPNYKPFGSWGLYIGGNPADGYYSNYYKALSNSVDKQQVGAVEPSVKPGVASAAGVNQASAFGPMVKQASYPYSSYQDQVYPFDYYTQSDLSAGSRIVPVESQAPSSYSSASVTSGRVSPVQVGAQVYGAPVAFTGSEQPSSYVDSYVTKKSATGQQVKSESQVQPSSAKGVVQKRYGYSYAPSVMPYYQQQQSHYQYQAAPQQPGQQQPQVMAYPVPVGSQIVGSQPGTDGAYQPYGVHGYTRYAIKPTVVSSEQSYYQVQSAPQFPVYKQQQQAQQAAPQPQYQAQHAPAVYQPMSFYGYPMSQLHYSQASMVPSVEQQVGASPVGSIDVASSEKSETTVEKTQGTVHKEHQPQQPHQHQKRA